MTQASEHVVPERGTGQNGLLAHFVLGRSATEPEGAVLVAGHRSLPPPLGQRQFWDAFVWRSDGDRPDSFGPYVVDLYVADRLGLRLSVGSDDDLYLLHPDLLPPPHLALLNNYHCWQPFALRWEELDAIGRRVSERAGLPHPGIPLLLLAGFTLPEPGQRPEALDMLRRGFETLDLFDAAAINELVCRYDYGEGPARALSQDAAGGALEGEPVEPELSRYWAYDARYGWVMEGDDGYSFRIARNEAFPFGTLRDLVRLARDRGEAHRGAAQLELPLCPDGDA